MFSTRKYAKKTDNRYDSWYLTIVDPESPEYDNSGREENVNNQSTRDHRFFGVARFLLENVLVDGLNTQTLSRWTVHYNVDPKYLHSVQRIRYAHQRRESY